MAAWRLPALVPEQWKEPDLAAEPSSPLPSLFAHAQVQASLPGGCALSPGQPAYPTRVPAGVADSPPGPAGTSESITHRDVGAEARNTQFILNLP